MLCRNSVIFPCLRFTFLSVGDRDYWVGSVVLRDGSHILPVGTISVEYIVHVFLFFRRHRPRSALVNKCSLIRRLVSLSMRTRKVGGAHAVINPRRACAARVTVVVVCVCRLVANSLLKGQFVLKTLSHTQRATKVKKFVGFSLKPLRCRDTALARCTATRAVGHFYSAENAHAQRPCARACVVAI